MNPLIQWPSHKYWTKAYNPVIGCKKISEGCQNCWAEQYAKRMMPEFVYGCCKWGQDFSKCAKHPPRSGVVFVGNMTDIFGEWNNRSRIREIIFFECSRKAINLVLTKRADRMPKVSYPGAEQQHIWWGITAENQLRYDERIDAIRSMPPGSSTWLSAEPLLGQIDMQLCYIAPEDMPFKWVVVGAESGSNRRPCKLEWIESIVKQCRAANVPVFVKQIELNGKLVKDINKFPEHLQIRQVPWAKQEACQ